MTESLKRFECVCVCVRQFRRKKTKNHHLRWLIFWLFYKKNGVKGIWLETNSAKNSEWKTKHLGFRWVGMIWWFSFVPWQPNSNQMFSMSIICVFLNIAHLWCLTMPEMTMILKLFYYDNFYHDMPWNKNNSHFECSLDALIVGIWAEPTQTLKRITWLLADVNSFCHSFYF